ncbi:hypothetical protein QTP88_025280 [Uroleucon formosanum]
MPLDQAHHYSAPDVFGNRASFRTVTDPACLFVDEVHRNDEGVYRCRVDFRNSATKSFRYNLSVIGNRAVALEMVSHKFLVSNYVKWGSQGGEERASPVKIVLGTHSEIDTCSSEAPNVPLIREEIN